MLTVEFITLPSRLWLAFPLVNSKSDEINTLSMNQANTASGPSEGLVPNPKACLREQVREVMRF